jgi:hypothetical protein
MWKYADTDTDDDKDDDWYSADRLMKEVTKNTRRAPYLLLIHPFPVQFLLPSFESKKPIKVWCDVS